MRWLRASVGLAVLAVAGCATSPAARQFPTADDPDVAAAVDQEALPGAFTVCHGYGCQWRSPVGLRPPEWHAIIDLFATSPATPAEERRRVAKAVAIVERSVGEQIGTIADKPMTPFSIGDRTQLDCIDESINTSTTLHLLQGAGYLRWHKIGNPAQRGIPLFFNMHFTAVLIENGTGNRYAVDSWFYEPGVPPAVLPLAVWRDNWHPGDPQTAAAR